MVVTQKQPLARHLPVLPNWFYYRFVRTFSASSSKTTTSHPDHGALPLFRTQLLPCILVLKLVPKTFILYEVSQCEQLDQHDLCSSRL